MVLEEENGDLQFNEEEWTNLDFFANFAYRERYLQKVKWNHTNEAKQMLLTKEVFLSSLEMIRFLRDKESTWSSRLHGFEDYETDLEERLGEVLTRKLGQVLKANSHSILVVNDHNGIRPKMLYGHIKDWLLKTSKDAELTDLTDLRLSGNSCKKVKLCLNFV